MRKKMRLRHTLLFFLLLTAALIFPACAKTEIESEKGYWHAEEIELPEKYKFVSGKVLYQDGAFLIDGKFELDPEHPELDQYDIVLKVDALTGETMVDTPDQKGDILARSELSDCVCTVSGEFTDDHYENVKLTKTDKKGNVLAEYDCGELFGVNISSFRYTASGTGSGFYIRAIAGKSDELYVVSNTGALRIGDEISRVDSKKMIMSAALGNDGLIVFTDEQGGVYQPDFASGELKKSEFPAGTETALIRPFPLENYSFGGVVRDRIYGYSRNADGMLVSELICDLSDSGVAGSISGAASGGGVFCIALWDEMSKEQKYFRLTETEPSERETLTLAFVGKIAQYENYAVAEFNRTHDSVKLELKRYELTPDETGSVLEKNAIEAFERDIVAGDLPDIVLTSGSADVGGYAAKGLFTDLYGLMDESKRADLSPFVKEFETDFKGQSGLYFLPLNNKITTLVGRRSEFPEGLSLDIFLDRLENPGKDKNLRVMRLSKVVYESIGEFIDADTGESDFGGELFRRFAGDYKKFGGQLFGDGNANDLASGRLLLHEIDLSVSSLVKLKAQQGINDLEILGYPGSAPCVEPGLYLGITKDCRDIQSASEYVDLRTSEKYLLYASKDPYLTKSGFEKYISGQNRYYYFAASGSGSLSYAEKPTGRRLEAIPEQIGAGYYEYELGEDILAMVKDTLEIAKPRSRMDNKLADIALEELEILRQRDSRTLDETVKIIDDRVRTCLNESK